MRKIKRHNKKYFEFSKIIITLTGLLFIICLFIGFQAGKDTLMDTTIYAVAITVSGGIFGTSTLWYFKKAQAENTVKLKTSVYETAMNTKLKYTEELIDLKKRYGIINDEILEDLDMENFVASSLSDLSSCADEAMAEATASIESQQF